MVDIITVQSDATQPFGDAHVELGDTALISIPVEGGTIEVVLWTARTQTFHPAAFESVGCSGLAQRPLLVVKSTNHFFGGFGPIARSIHYVDTGLTHPEGSPYPSNPHQTGYKNLERGIWPLVDDPHGIGSKHVPWVRPKGVEVGEEEVEALAARL